MPYLFIGLGLAIFVYVALTWYSNASPKALLNAGKWIILALAGVVALILVATGRFGLLWVVLMGALPWISRLGNLRTILKNMQGPSGGQSSTVRTRLLAMSLDHDSGRMDGTVLDGPYKDRRLSDLELDDLKRLLAQAAGEDPKSAELLEAYLDREYAGQWRGQPGGEGWEDDSRRSHSNYRGSTGMSPEEALEVLGLKPGASEDDIRAAHKRLMKTAHPDAGGSDYLAARINEAKDVLLRR